MPWDGDRQKDYIQVDARIQEFYAKYPDGRLQSEIVEFQVEGRGEVTTRSGKQDVLIGYVLVKAYAYRTPDDPLPGIGLSSMLMPGGTPYTRNSEVENAETSAWGRAIAAVGLEVRKGIATADEIRNKESDGTPYEVRITPSAASAAPGGHQDGITRPQIVEIINLSKQLDYNPSETALIVAGLTDRPIPDMTEDEEEQKTVVKRLLATLSAEEGGMVIQTLTTTRDADAESDAGLPDIPDTKLEQDLALSLNLMAETAGTADGDN